MAAEELQDDLDQTQPAEPAPVLAEPPESRFLFVDIAAMRAKQLRRGALPRLGSNEGHHPVKAERIAMEEVRKGLVGYDIVTPKTRPSDD